jgi:hyperosmotically inducible protein
LQRYGMPVVKPIRIIVKNGHVTLVGVVDSVGDKNLAGLRANTAPGVFSVKNDLAVAK